MSIVLAGIFVYPVKALRGVALNQVEAQLSGLAGDRRWVLVDPAGRFVSQRTHPALARIGAWEEGDTLTLKAQGHPDLTVSQPDDRTRRTVSIWRDNVEAAAANANADHWLSNVLGDACHLAWMDPACQRPISSTGGRPGETVSFADGYPCLIISEASLADLNSRLSEPVPMNRFRPNLVVSGCAGFAEDRWSRLQIGEVVFRAAGPCARCSVTTVDQVTGEQLTNEPLRTLATYRQGPEGANFGTNLIVEKTGMIRVGDMVRVS